MQKGAGVFHRLLETRKKRNKEWWMLRRQVRISPNFVSPYASRHLMAISGFEIFFVS
jgi:hypothetical protein